MNAISRYQDTSIATIHKPNPLTTLHVAADSLESLRPKDVDIVIHAADYFGEEHLVDVHKMIRKGTPEQRAALSEAMAELAPFMENVQNGYLKFHLKLAERKASRAELRREIKEQFGEDLTGLQLSNDKKNLFILFLRDASVPGKFRYAMFTKSGFNGHSSHDSFIDALNDAIQCGYRNMAGGTLEKYERLDSFKEGNANASNIQLMNGSQS